jgi:hypothetical protein
LIKQKIHIVALDVPFPADYGGAIDIFYRIKALYELGYEITLHVFEYGRGKQQELTKFAKVNYYSRNKSFLQLFSSRPFIVQTRRSKELLANLLQDDAPILFEGIHTTWFLENEAIQRRITFVRMHNIEHEYYRGLKNNSSFFKRIHFHQEAIKLEKYQSILRFTNHVLAIKESDVSSFKKFNNSVHFLPASIPDIPGRFTKVKRYSLFHGNLSVPENEAAVKWIISALKQVIDSTFTFIIAGKNPSKNLQELCKKNHITLISNPSEEELDLLIQEAQIHVLYTGVPSGIKLKILACVHSSGQILANDKMVSGTSIEEFCTIANDPKHFKIHYLGLQNSAITLNEFQARSKFIQTHFNNQRNCLIISKLLSDETIH